MLKVSNCIYLLILFLSCNNNSEKDLVNSLKKEIIKLEKENKSLRYIKNEKIAPIVIDMNKENDTNSSLKFAISFLYDRPLLLDSIIFSLYKVNENNHEILLQTQKEKHNFKLDDPNYYTVANYKKLKKGNYIIKGYLICKKQKMDLQYQFVVK